MRTRGDHSWDIVVDYIRCPKCGWINEDRQRYQYRMGEYEKDITCAKCAYAFVKKKNYQPSFGPLIGDPEPGEINWEDYPT